MERLMEKPKTIYLVSDGDYSDYQILIATTDKEEEEKYIKLFGKGTIEEFENGLFNHDPYLFSTTIDINGKIVDRNKLLQACENQPWQSDLRTMYDNNVKHEILCWHNVRIHTESIEGLLVFGRTQDEADKIAIEKWTQAKAQMENI